MSNIEKVSYSLTKEAKDKMEERINQLIAPGTFEVEELLNWDQTNTSKYIFKVPCVFSQLTRDFKFTPDEPFYTKVKFGIRIAAKNAMLAQNEYRKIVTEGEGRYDSFIHLRTLPVKGLSEKLDIVALTIAPTMKADRKVRGTYGFTYLIIGYTLMRDGEQEDIDLRY